MQHLNPIAITTTTNSKILGISSKFLQDRYFWLSLRLSWLVVVVVYHF